LDVECRINPMGAEDREEVIDLFNYYVENSFAAFPESRVPYQAYDLFLQMSSGLPTSVLREGEGKLLGFGMLRKYNPMPAFSHAAEISYFIAPEHTGKGLGGFLLAHLERESLEKGITTILAQISSLNGGSIRFHGRNGFVECGRFRDVGRKHGRLFDAVWMQKTLRTPPDP
jgi:L-amino acid N-acyltransferase YncA